MNKRRLTGQGQLWKRLVSVWLIVSMVMSFGSFASAAEPDSMTVGSAKGWPGDTVDVPVSLTPETMIWQYDVTVHYDPDVLEVVKVTDERGVVSKDTFEADATSAGTVKVKAKLLESLFTEETKVFTIRFKIKSTATTGDSKVDPVAGVVYEGDNPITAAATAGNVTVRESNAATVEIGSASGTAGQTVQIPVRVTKATAGIAAYQMQIDFDKSALEVAKITGESGDDFDSNYNNTGGWLRTAWVDRDGGETPLAAGDKLFTVTFKIKQTATVGDKSYNVQTKDLEHFSMADASAHEMNKSLSARAVTVAAGTPPLPPDTTPGTPTPVTPTPESQEQLNQQVVQTIKNSNDAGTILNSVDQVLAHLQKVNASTAVDQKRKWQVIASTVTTVFGTLLEKKDQGIVEESQVVERTKKVLEQAVSEAQEDTQEVDWPIIAEAQEAVAQMANTIIAKPKDDAAKDKLAGNMSELMSILLATVNAADQKELKDTGKVAEKIDRLSGMVNRFTESLGKHASQFELAKTMTIHTGKSVKKRANVTKDAQAVSSLLTLSGELAEKMAEKEVNLQVETAENTGLFIPTTWLQVLDGAKLGVSIKKNSRVALPKGYSEMSKAYDVSLLANGKAMKMTDGKERDALRLSIPYDKKGKKLLAYRYDEKEKKWKQVTTSNGKAAAVTKEKNRATLETASTGTFLVAEVLVQDIKLKETKMALLAGEQKQLEVTGTYPDGSKGDVSAAEYGTTYKSSNSKVATVSEDGLVTIASNARSGKTVKITVENGKTTKTVTIQIASIKKITVTASQQEIAPGESVQLNVNATLTSGGKRDVTKGNAGTTYQLAETEYATISEDGLLEVKKDAPAGTKLTIIASNGKVTDQLELIVNE
ncbi:cohesin domain-containing protein [Brevibacillus ginsengisoli]|uniref:cohesin domain-containing protein n=1 Tax=Brevibacillus ginsengisoli TaxID=363854 RepID=UPI003CF713BB